MVEPCPASQQTAFSRIYLDISFSSTGAHPGYFQRDSWKIIPSLSIGCLTFQKFSGNFFYGNGFAITGK